MAEPDPSTPSATTAEWEQWRRGMFGDPHLVWHDGPDFTALLHAARSNTQSVTRMLAAGISAGDSLAAESVTALTVAGLAPVQLEGPCLLVEPGGALPVDLPAQGADPNDFADLGEVEDRLLAFQRRSGQAAVPFAWRFTRADLDRLLRRLAGEERLLAVA